MNYWTRDEDELLSRIYGKMPMGDVVNALPSHTRGSIYKRANKLGLKGTAWRRYSVNHEFFATLTPSACYWAGFIAADGCIGKDCSVSIALAIKDKDHLQRFVRDVAFTGPIREDSNLNLSGTVSHSCRVQIWGVPEWHRDLKRHFSITPRKSLTLEPPSNLSREQALAFIVGYIDGDGSVRWDRGRKRADGSIARKFCLDVVGTKPMLEWVRCHFATLVAGAENRRVYMVNNHPALRYSGSQARRIHSLLMESPCPQRMPRKWEQIAAAASSDYSGTSRAPSTFALTGASSGGTGSLPSYANAA